jgi:hypothetical protein
LWPFFSPRYQGHVVTHAVGAKPILQLRDIQGEFLVNSLTFCRDRTRDAVLTG